MLGTRQYNNDGSFYTELANRDLGNLIVLAPGKRIRWNRWRERCENEAAGFYAEDVRPFGFRVISQTTNGFSFTAKSISETATSKIYSLTIVDPSEKVMGDGSYSWIVQDANFSGHEIQISVQKDEPIKLTIKRTRHSQTDTIEVKDRGSDLDRLNGKGFILNLVH